MPVDKAVLYGDMTDEQIVAIQRRIETFTKSNEYFDKFMNHVKRERGSKTFRQRRVVKPVVKPEDVKVAVEDVAPRPSSIAVATFERSVDVYRDKIPYTAEDVMFGYDDIVKIAGDTLAEITVQKLDYIKGAPFLKTRATITAGASVLATLANAAIILKKNGAKRWGNGRYLAMVTPETLEKIRTELEAKGSSISEPTKVDIDSGIIGHYGLWDFSEVPNDLFYDLGNSAHWMVLLGKRTTGESPIDCANIDGVEVINNPLGSGILVDEDGNFTADDNKQRGSVAVNVNGLGAYVNDDLCVLKCNIYSLVSTLVGNYNGSLGGTDMYKVSQLTGYISESFSPEDFAIRVFKADGTFVGNATSTFYLDVTSSITSDNWAANKASVYTIAGTTASSQSSGSYSDAATYYKVVTPADFKLGESYKAIAAHSGYVTKAVDFDFVAGINYVNAKFTASV